MSAPATVPTEPVTWTAEHISPVDMLPPQVKALYLSGWCSAIEASDFLGLARKHSSRDGREYESASESVRRRLSAYADRIEEEKHGGLVSMDSSRPRKGELRGFMTDGTWQVDTRWLVAEKYPETAPW